MPSICLDKYNCFNKNCALEAYTENVEYGYYSRKNGDCLSCQDRCSSDEDCGGLECGLNYCLWWKHGKCNKVQERNKIDKTLQTCLKGEHRNY